MEKQSKQPVSEKRIFINRFVRSFLLVLIVLGSFHGIVYYYHWSLISANQHQVLDDLSNTINTIQITVSFLILTLSLVISYLHAKAYALRQSSITKLTQSEQKLQKANITKDKFISILAHDLKNPLASIIGSANYLLEEYGKLSDDEKRSFLRNINKASTNLTELIDDILTWALSQSGEIEWGPKNFTLIDTIWEAVRMIEAQASQKEIDIIVSGKNDIEVYADQQMVKTIFRNLISNAIKFSVRNSEIQVSIEKGANAVTILIQDFGTGIPAHEQEMLFRLDNRLQTQGTENETGTGLGLILCKEFIEQNHGKIWVDSTEGKGTTVGFTLPTKRE